MTSKEQIETFLAKQSTLTRELLELVKREQANSNQIVEAGFLVGPMLWATAPWLIQFQQEGESMIGSALPGYQEFASIYFSCRQPVGYWHTHPAERFYASPGDIGIAGVLRCDFFVVAILTDRVWQKVYCNPSGYPPTFEVFDFDFTGQSGPGGND